MKIGLLCRAEERGLGSLSRDFHDNLAPDKTLLIVPGGVRRHGLTTHAEWYPNATVALFDGRLPEHVCREWLADLDVVLSFETFYDWQFCDWARDARCATVCMAMPEWWRPQWAPCPTRWWAPTSYRIDHLPPGTRHVPVPMTPRPRPSRRPGPFRWLHVGGARLPDESVHADRNGTHAVLEAATLLQAEQEILIRTQSPGLESSAPCVKIAHESVPDRWSLYDDADALILPRRYAGLSLPVLEAFACGLPVVMTDLAPQNVDWPVCTVPTKPGADLRMPGGTIPTGDADPHALAALMDAWATHPPGQLIIENFAEQNSWETRRPQILTELELAADLVTA